MTETVTRATPARPAPATPVIPTTPEINLGRGFVHVVNQAANARQVRLEAERIENPLKDKRMEMIVRAMGGTLPEGQRLVVKAMGVVRGTISWRPSRKVDMDLLREAFPEAYTACVTEGTYPQYDPA